MDVKPGIHSFLSEKCEVRESKSGGYGVFAGECFEKDELISVWGGKIYSEAEIEALGKDHPHFASHPVSVYPGFYLGPTSLEVCDEAEMFNHHCDPNAGVRGQIVVVARRRIIPGEEICFDYDTTEVIQDPFECRCGSPLCRGTIDGSGWKDDAFRQHNQGYLSWYIENLISEEIE